MKALHVFLLLFLQAAETVTFPDINSNFSNILVHHGNLYNHAAVPALIYSLSYRDGDGGGVVCTVYDSVSFSGLFNTRRLPKLSIVGGSAADGQSSGFSFPIAGAQGLGHSLVATTVLRPAASGSYQFSLRAGGPASAYLVMEDGRVHVISDAWDEATTVPDPSSHIALGSINRTRPFVTGPALSLTAGSAYHLLVTHASPPFGDGDLFLQLAWSLNGGALSEVGGGELSPSIAAGVYVTQHLGHVRSTRALTTFVQPTFGYPLVGLVGSAMTYHARFTAFYTPPKYEYWAVYAVFAHSLPKLFFDGVQQDLFPASALINTGQMVWITSTRAMYPYWTYRIDLEVEDRPRQVSGGVQSRVWTLAFDTPGLDSQVSVVAREQFGSRVASIGVGAVVTGRAHTPEGSIAWDACSMDRVPPSAMGAVVFVQRGGCDYSTKAAHVARKGGVGLGIFEVGANGTQPPEIVILPQDAQGGHEASSVAVFSLTYEDALALLVHAQTAVLASVSQVADGNGLLDFLWASRRHTEWPYDLDPFVLIHPRHFLPGGVSGLHSITRDVSLGTNISHVSPVLHFPIGSLLSDIVPGRVEGKGPLFSDYYGIITPRISDTYNIRFTGVGWVELLIDSNEVTTELVQLRLASTRNLPYRRGLEVNETYAQLSVWLQGGRSYKIEVRWDVNRRDVLRVIDTKSLQGTLEWRSAHMCGVTPRLDYPGESSDGSYTRVMGRSRFWNPFDEFRELHQDCPFQTIPSEVLTPDPCAGGIVIVTYGAALEVSSSCVCNLRPGGGNGTHCADLECRKRFGRDCIAPSIEQDVERGDVYSRSEAVAWTDDSTGSKEDATPSTTLVA